MLNAGIYIYSDERHYSRHMFSIQRIIKEYIPKLGTELIVLQEIRRSAGSFNAYLNNNTICRRTFEFLGHAASLTCLSLFSYKSTSANGFHTGIFKLKRAVSR